MKKRLVSMILSSVAVCNTVPVAAFAEDANTQNSGCAFGGRNVSGFECAEGIRH